MSVIDGGTPFDRKLGENRCPKCGRASLASLTCRDCLDRELSQLRDKLAQVTQERNELMAKGVSLCNQNGLLLLEQHGFKQELSIALSQNAEMRRALEFYCADPHNSQAQIAIRIDKGEYGRRVLSGSTLTQGWKSPEEVKELEDKEQIFKVELKTLVVEWESHAEHLRSVKCVAKMRIYESCANMLRIAIDAMKEDGK
jgi:hypothetical protein